MDGNYSSLMPQRMARATGLILLGDSRWPTLMRYFYRTLFQRERAGALAGTRDSVKWAMIRWIMINSPRSLARYRQMLPATGLPLVETRSMHQLNRLYAEWQLARP